MDRPMESQPAKPIITSLLEPLPPLVQGHNDLGDPGVVELLVRGFVDQALAAFKGALAGEFDQDTAVDAINRQAIALNAVFLGTSGFDTVIVHPWNAADQLGLFLRDTLDLDAEPEDSVRAALVLLATRVMQAIQGRQDVWSDDVDGLIVQARDLLLGQLPE